MENKAFCACIVLLAGFHFVGVASADECPKTIKETGWSPINKRPLYSDVSSASGADRLSNLQKRLGKPSYTRTIGGKPEALWIYGARKRVATNDCGKVDVKYFLEAHLLSVGLDGDRIVSCKVLRRTIVSTSIKISPIQDRDVLPFTIEENTCKDWLALNPSKQK